MYEQLRHLRIINDFLFAAAAAAIDAVAIDGAVVIMCSMWREATERL